MSFPLEPQGDKLIVRPFKRKDEKLNSIIIPSTANAELEVGEILAVSPDVTNFKVGNIVTYPSKTGVGQLINGDPCLWITQPSIWGVWDKDKWESLNAEN